MPLTLTVPKDGISDEGETLNIGLGSVTSRLDGGTSETDNFVQLVIKETYSLDADILADFIEWRDHMTKISDGLNEVAGGYTSAQCRSAANSLGVAALWESWCAEIQRREDD